MQLIFLSVLTLGIATLAAGAIEPAIYETLQSKNTVNIIVSFKTKANLARIVSQFSIQGSNTRSRADLMQSVYTSMKTFADETQRSAMGTIYKLSALTRSTSTSAPRPSYQVRQLWITNELYIKNADKTLLAELKGRDDIASITHEKFIPFPETKTNITSINPFSTFSRQGSSSQWGIEKIGAPQVWAKGFTGAGVVVAIIDSGVRASHEALRDGFRKYYGWFDAVDGTTEPFDDSGHGTNTMGTIVGRTNGIGVAPGAHWIACRACNKDGCSDFTLKHCGQWTLCPTDAYENNPRCDLTPHVVSHSWGWTSQDSSDFYGEIIEAYRKLNITSFFASGNQGDSRNSCGTVKESAGSFSDDAIVVGATTSEDKVSSFSSAGPAPNGRIKPDIVAPGSNILSAGHSSDNDYITDSGSSLACPHAAGVAALMLSKKPGMTPKEVKNALIQGAIPTIPGTKSCGGVDENTFPNNHAGWGRISASTSFNSL